MTIRKMLNKSKLKKGVNSKIELLPEQKNF